MKIGGIGSVATSLDYRRQGLSQNILRRQTEWMIEQQYDLSLLFAVITPFYEKAGWNVVNEPFYELTIDQLPNTTLPAEYEIVPFQTSHMQAMSHIYEQFNLNRSYTVIRPPSFWSEQLLWPRWRNTVTYVVEKNGRPVAYGQRSAPNEGVAHIEELCYLYGEERVAHRLLHTLANHEPHVKTILMRLPEDHALFSAFLEWNATKKQYTHAMWKVLRFQPLLEKLTSVFERRLTEQSVLFTSMPQLHFTCVDQEAYFHFAEDQLTIDLNPRDGLEYVSINLSQEDFITLLFQGADALPPTTLQLKWLNVLFPKQYSVFYLTDKF